MNPPTLQTHLVPGHALQQAGLQQGVHQAGDFEIALLSRLTLLRLHSLETRETLNANLQGSGMQLPGKVNQATGLDPSVLCLAPSEWLVTSEYLGSQQLLPTLQAAIDPGQSALLDQAAGFAVFRLRGAVTPWLLSKCAGLDWRTAAAQEQQHCCRTLLDRVPAMLHYHRPGSGSVPWVFDVMIERSLARHTWQMLLDRLPHALELMQQHDPG